MIAFLVLAKLTTLTAIRDSYPTLSPNGSVLLFSSNRSGRQALWTAKADGSDPHLLFDDPTAGADPGTAAFSPDGRRIVFAMTPAGASDENESEIYLIAADGTGLIRLTSVPGDDSHPHWSSDGKRIFFNSARATPDLKADWGEQWIDIYSMTQGGSDIRRITDCRAICTFPVPSPDGRSVVYRKVIDSPGFRWDQSASKRDSEIFVTRLDNGETRNLSNDAHFDGWPTWSPDGRWIAFASGRDGTKNAAQIYRIHPDGAGLERLTQGPFSYAQPSYAGTGSILAYQSMETEESELGGIVRLAIPSN